MEKGLELIRSKNKKNKHWFNEECKEIMEKRKAIRKKWLTDKNNEEKNGDLITDEEKALEEWRRYFEELLSSSTHVIDENGEEIFQNVHPWVEKPTTEEVKNAIKSMKRRKAPGIDGINAEKLQEKKLIRLARICAEVSKTRVRVKGILSASFQVKTGVKRRYCLSPLLFNLALGKAINRVAEMETGLQIGRKVNILAYADDVVLIGENKEELRNMMKVLVKQIKEVGLEINIEKTKYLPISRCHHVGPRPRAIDMDGVILKKIEDFKYLGGLLNHGKVDSDKDAGRK
ncbi:hypothetical protein PR048_000594 [Dryococelus australis]|uniref:Reverse transcriptase domain-containing protein n=1 Tax=Dryococelus australis TaxID=614101 RepID=A0ABQ9IGA9_9NEOP|nr:hypothetical protein PR048_000594 [Dryococelus australis]